MNLGSFADAELQQLNALKVENVAKALMTFIEREIC